MTDHYYCDLCHTAHYGAVNRCSEMLAAELLHTKKLHRIDARAALFNQRMLVDVMQELRSALKVVEAARSVLSEDGVREYLSAYVMGVELIDRLDAYPGEK